MAASIRKMSTLAKNSHVLSRLRESMASAVEGGLAAYIVPSGDPHNSEYVAEHDMRRIYLTGFSGSAGTAAVTPTQAMMWTDGRYFQQAEEELSHEWTLMKAGQQGVPTVHDWLAEHAEEGGSVGVDPTLTTIGEARRLKAAFRAKGRDVRLVPVAGNLVDALWEAQPPRPANPVAVHPLKYAGQAVGDKLAGVRKAMASKGATALVVSALDEVAWLFNLRGSDIPFNPVTYAYAVVTMDDVTLYMDSSKASPAVIDHLKGVALAPYEEVLAGVAAAASAEGARVWVDSSTCNLAVYDAIGGASTALVAASPVELAKAVKNDVEIDGFRACNRRDAAALVSFFAWLEREVEGDAASELTEYSIVARLEAFRAAQDLFVSPSFETIAASGANGAIIHYTPVEGAAARITKDAMFMLDSGGQYLDGTTDTTRTVHFGTPSARERRCFTRVLQGHIAVATVVFPAGTEGHVLDGLARVALWQDGCNFQHGTGHGVGSYLNVHEGPHGLSSRARPYKGGIQAGMTTSNEPGHYERDHFGVRIESVHVAVPAGDGCTGPRDGFLRFENLTPVPIQTKLVDTTLLAPAELKWLNDFNAWCYETLAPELTGDALAYLKRETQPLVVEGSVAGAGAGAGAGSS